MIITNTFSVGTHVAEWDNGSHAIPGNRIQAFDEQMKQARDKKLNDPVKPLRYSARDVWLSAAFYALRRLHRLRDGWNSYQAKQLDLAILSVAESLLRKLATEELLRPTLVPTVAGGVQIEWHERGVDLEIELLSPERFRLSYDDASEQREESLEGEVADFSSMQPFFAKLKLPRAK